MRSSRTVYDAQIVKARSIGGPQTDARERVPTENRLSVICLPAKSIFPVRIQTDRGHLGGCTRSLGTGNETPGTEVFRLRGGPGARVGFSRSAGVGCLPCWSTPDAEHAGPDHASRRLLPSIANLQIGKGSRFDLVCGPAKQYSEFPATIPGLEKMIRFVLPNFERIERTANRKINQLRRYTTKLANVRTWRTPEFNLCFGDKNAGSGKPGFPVGSVQ